MSGRPKSSSPDAVRKRESRQRASSRTSSTVAGRAGETSKGNPLRPDDPLAKAGEPLGQQEATDQLKYAHVGIAKIMRSSIDLDELDEEFEVAGKNYAYVANHLWTPLRVIIRFVAPLVLLGALVAIWAAIISETPWMQGVRSWWQRRGSEEEQRQVDQVLHDIETPPMRPVVVQQAEQAEERKVAPPLPRRATVVRNLRGVQR